MQSAIVTISVCFAIISNTQSQRLFTMNSRNPVSSVKDFADGIQQQRWQGRLISEKYGNNQHLLSDMLEMRAVNGNTSDCDISLQIFWADLLQKKKYALRMLDSWGKIESGILTGDIRWFGRYYECINSHTSQFSGKYFFMNWGEQIATGFSVCLPSTCSTEEAEEVGYPLINLLKINVKASSPVQPTEYTAADIVGIVILAFLGCLVITGTVYELYLDCKEPTDEEQDCIVDEIEDKSSVWRTVILSFSFIKNSKAIFDTTQKKGNINVLHGLRFFSMTWVVLGHVVAFGFSFYDNGVDVGYYYITSLSFQAIGNATFSVDSFFFLSGLLATYLGLKEMNKRKGKINIPLMYAYRYLRLTPAYALCILLLTGIISKFGDGPLWPFFIRELEAPCQAYWWTNLLYINNIYPINAAEQCFGWGWYLANDMQFYLFLPLLLLIMYRHPKVGTFVLGIIVIIGMAVSGALSAHYEQQPLPLLTGLYLYPVVQLLMFENEGSYATDYSKEIVSSYSANTTTAAPPPPGPSQSDLFWSDTYTKPWCRMNVYFIGVMTGLLLYSTNIRARMNKITATIGWIVAFATGLAIIYGLFGSIKVGQPVPVDVAAFYNAVCRPIWALCLMWVVIACTAGYGGPINAFLSWKVFIPLSRLAYCVYLVHPIVIFYIYGVMEDQLHCNVTMISTLFAGILCLSFLCAFVISVLIEMPMLGITKAMFGKTKVKSSVTSAQYTNEIKL